MALAEQTNDEEQSISPKVVAPAAIIMALLIVVSYFNGLTFSKSPYLVLGFAHVLILFALSHFLPKLNFGKSHFIYLYTYHWLLAFMLIFVAPTLSYFLYLWVMLMYMAEYFYQTKGVIFSALSLTVVMFTGVLYQHGGLTPDLIRQIIPELITIIIVSFVMSRLAFGNGQQRKDMANKIVHAEYEHGRLVALINSMSDAVIATDEDGKILTYNAAALDILNTNMTLTDIKISDVLKLVDPKGNSVDALDFAKQTSYLKRTDKLSIPISKDDKVDLDMSISRIARSTLLAKQQGYTFLMRDITEQKSLDEEKDLFISEVSHELRTPITIAEGDMSMAVLLLEKPELKIDQIKDSIEKAHEQVIFLADMVNDLSALSRAQREDKGMDISTFEIETVINELDQMYRPQIEKKGLYLKFDIAPSVPTLTTSKLYFQEIMQNFITNAMKYTEKGGITVKAQAIDKDNIIIGVTDTGVGISKSEQSKVFQKFWRSEDLYTRSTSGTGLGLYITAKLTHRLGGTLRLESKLKEGSTFSIILPTKAFKTVDQVGVVKNEVAHLFD